MELQAVVFRSGSEIRPDVIARNRKCATQRVRSGERLNHRRRHLPAGEPVTMLQLPHTPSQVSEVQHFDAGWQLRQALQKRFLLA